MDAGICLSLQGACSRSAPVPCHTAGSSFTLALAVWGVQSMEVFAHGLFFTALNYLSAWDKWKPVRGCLPAGSGDSDPL